MRRLSLSSLVAHTAPEHHTDPPVNAPLRSVTDPEPLPSSSPLWTLPNCIVTPHMSALSSEYWQRALGVLALNAARLADGDEGVNVFRAPKVGA